MSLSFGALAVALMATPAVAQPIASADDDEIVVTAQRRDEASLDVPISVTTLSPEALTTANVDSLADTQRLTPNLRFDSQGAAVQPTIRGVGTAVTTSGGGPNVGVYVDGFFSANTYVTDFDLMNVRSIQVLKGPQGTLFGRNTTGGAILVTTADPSTETGGAVSASYGRFNEAEGRAYFTTGLSDNIAWDIEGQIRTGDGYVTNLATNDDEAGAFENWSARTGLLWDITPNVSLLLRYTHAETDDPTSMLVNAYVDPGSARFYDQVSGAGLTSYGATYPTVDTSNSVGQPLVHLLAVSTPGTYVTTPGQVVLPGRTSFTSESDSFQATVRADLGFANLTSYTQYRKDDSPAYEDLDATAIPFFDILIGVEDETVSQEFVLNSKGDGRLQWTAGLAYFSAEDIWDVDASFGGPYMDFGGSGTTSTSYAVFADATYEFADRWFVTLGARYSYDEVTDAYFNTNITTTGYEAPDGSIIPAGPLDPSIPAGTRIDVADLDNDAVTPRLVLRYEPNDVSSIYASFTRGYKAGILNVGGLSQRPVEPEEIDAYEIGYKFDNRIISFDTAAFFYDYQNLQFSSYQNGAAQIRNADSAEVYGLEAQTRIRVTDNFTLFGGVAYTHAEYERFENAPYYTYCDPTATPFVDAIACVPNALGGLGDGAITQIEIDADGNQMQRSPEFTMNLGAAYDIQDVGGGVLTLSGNIYYTSEFFFDANEQFKQGGYEVMSLRAQWVDPSGRYTLAAFGDNVTNERYQTQVLFNTLGIGSVWSAPSTYGVSISARY